MRHIITDRFASIYATQLPGYRDGASCPVCFNRRTGRYEAFVTGERADGTRYTTMRAQPHSSDIVQTMRAGQRADYYAAVLS